MLDPADNILCGSHFESRALQDKKGDVAREWRGHES